jgi:hypothetical protein
MSSSRGIPVQYCNEFKSNGYLKVPLQLILGWLSIPLSSLLHDLATRRVQQFDNQNSKEFPARFNVHLVTNMGTGESEAINTSCGDLVKAVSLEYQNFFNDEVHDSSCQKTFRICYPNDTNLNATMSHDMSFTVALSGTTKFVEGNQPTEIILSAMTFICSNSQILICYMYVTDKVYDNSFGKGNNNKPFRGNGICRFMLQAAVLAQSIVRMRPLELPAVHLQLRPDSLSFNQFLALGFEIVTEYTPFNLEPPFWLFCHYHLSCQHGE